jgi:hypothetical protein
LNAIRVPLGAVVDWGQIRDVVLTALVVGIGMPAAFAVGLLGYVRANEPPGRSSIQVIAYGVVAVLGFGLFAAGVVLGITTMAQKD